MRGRDTRYKSGRPWRRVIVILCAGILLVGLVNCTTVTGQVKPTIPTLEPVDVDGMTCFTRADAEKLGVYIIELEQMCE